MTFDVPTPEFAAWSWWQWVLAAAAVWYPTAGISLSWHLRHVGLEADYDQRVEYFWNWLLSPLTVTLFGLAAVSLIGGNLFLWAVSFGIYPLPWDDYEKKSASADSGNKT